MKLQKDQRPSDHISIDVPTRVFPAGVVESMTGDAGPPEHRHRLLPSGAAVHSVAGLAPFSRLSYEKVVRKLMESLQSADGLTTGRSVPAEERGLAGARFTSATSSVWTRPPSGQSATGRPQPSQWTPFFSSSQASTKRYGSNTPQKLHSTVRDPTDHDNGTRPIL